MRYTVWLLGFWLMSGAAWGQTGISQPQIWVQGQGEVSAVPELARLRLAVSLIDPDSASAKQQVDERVAGLLTAIEGFDMVEQDTKASDLRLSPEYRYGELGRREQVGYRATRQVDLTLADLPRLSELLELTLEHGFTDIQQVELDVRERQAYLERARQQAIEDAITKAKSLAKGFGVHLGKIYRIEYQRPSGYQPVRLERNVKALESGESSYSQQRLSFSDQVSAVFLMQP